jgi:hypothetical protein
LIGQDDRTARRSAEINKAIVVIEVHGCYREILRSRRKPVGSQDAVTRRNEKTDSTYLRVFAPYPRERRDRHGAIAPGRIGQEHSPAIHAAKDDEMIVSMQAHRYDEGRALDQVTQRKLPEADAFVPVQALDRPLQIEQGKALARLNQRRIGQVLLALHQFQRHLAFGHGLAVLVLEYRRQRGRATAQVPFLNHHAFLSRFEKRLNRGALSRPCGCSEDNSDRQRNHQLAKDLEEHVIIAPAAKRAQCALTRSALI